MHSQELIKIIAAVAAAACVAFGILALFRGLRVDGEVDVSALFKGKVKTGSAGVLLLFFGVALFGIVVMKGYQSESREQIHRKPVWGHTPQAPNLPGVVASPSPWDTGVEIFETKMKTENVSHQTKDDKKRWWQFWK